MPQATSHTHIHTYMLTSYAEPNVPGTSYSSTYKHIHATSHSRLHVPRQMYLKLQATYTHVNATYNAEPWSSSTPQARRTHLSSQGSSAVEVECRDHGSLLANRVLYGRACLDNPPCDKMALVPAPAGCGRRLSGARALASVAAYGCDESWRSVWGEEGCAFAEGLMLRLLLGCDEIQGRGVGCGRSRALLLWVKI